MTDASTGCAGAEAHPTAAAASSTRTTVPATERIPATLFLMMNPPEAIRKGAMQNQTPCAATVSVPYHKQTQTLDPRAAACSRLLSRCANIRSRDPQNTETSMRHLRHI